MRNFSGHLGAAAAGGTLAALAFVVVSQTTATSGAVAAQERAKEQANAVPVLAAGFVSAEGKLTRTAGVKLSVKRVVVDKAFAGGRTEYHVVFAQELSSAPVVMATGSGKYELDVRATKKGFTVSFWDAKQRTSTECYFNFIVVKAGEITP